MKLTRFFILFLLTFLYVNLSPKNVNNQKIMSTVLYSTILLIYSIFFPFFITPNSLHKYIPDQFCIFSTNAKMMKCGVFISHNDPLPCGKWKATGILSSNAAWLQSLIQCSVDYVNMYRRKAFTAKPHSPMVSVGCLKALFTKSFIILCSCIACTRVC